MQWSSAARRLCLGLCLGLVLVAMGCISNAPSTGPILARLDEGFLVLARTFEDVAWDTRLGEEEPCTDDWRVIGFTLTRSARVDVSVSTGSRVAGTQLVPATPLPAGDHAFVVSHGAVADRIGGRRVFELLIRAIDEKEGAQTQHRIAGRLDRLVAGELHGRMKRYDVLIHSGELRLERDDLVLEGQGPPLGFARRYSAAARREGVGSALGEGWTHSHDLRLRTVASGETRTPFNLPAWVVDLDGHFFSPASLPKSASRPRLVQVTAGGGHFKRVDGRWAPQRSFHGSLLEETDAWIHVSTDGTRRVFPKRAADGAARPLRPPPDLPVSVVEDRFGNALRYAYVWIGGRVQPSRVSDAVGRSLEFSYVVGPEASAQGEAPRLSSVTGPDGIALHIEYDRQTGHLLAASRAERRESYRYARVVRAGRGDRRRVLVRVTDALGHATRIGYRGPHGLPDALIAASGDGDPVAWVRMPDGSRARFRYGEDDDGGIGSSVAATRFVRGPRGFETRYRLNATGNPVEIEGPLGLTTRIGWSIDQGDDDLVMSFRTDALGRTTRFRHDAAGRVILSEDASGDSTRRRFHPTLDLLEHEWDSRGNEIVNVYGPRGELLRSERTVDGRVETTRFEYDATGFRTAEWRAGEAPMIREKDALGLLARRGRKGGPYQRIIRDVRGRVVERVDFDGSITRLAYDDLDRVIREQTDTSVSEHRYDASGNEVVRVVDGTRIEFEYDEQGRLVKARSGRRERHFRWDAAGNLLVETDWKGRVRRHRYDALGRRVGEVPASVGSGTRESMGDGRAQGPPPPASR